jgi:hypothetical protein
LCRWGACLSIPDIDNQQCDLVIMTDAASRLRSKLEDLPWRRFEECRAKRVSYSTMGGISSDGGPLIMMWVNPASGPLGSFDERN